MKDAKITQTEAKAQDGFLASLHSLITHVKSKKSKTTRKKLNVVLLSHNKVIINAYYTLWWFS